MNDLNLNERNKFLADMALIGDALLKLTDATRINYDILGNTDNFLHAHIFPRYQCENPERLKMPVWFYSKDHWTSTKYQYDPQRDDALRNKLTEYLSN